MDVPNPRRVEPGAPLRWWQDAAILIWNKPLDWIVLLLSQVLFGVVAALLTGPSAIAIAPLLNIATVFFALRAASSADGAKAESYVVYLRHLPGLCFVTMLVQGLLVQGHWFDFLPFTFDGQGGGTHREIVVRLITRGVVEVSFAWSATTGAGLAFMPCIILWFPSQTSLGHAMKLGWAGAWKNLGSYSLAFFPAVIAIVLLPFAGLAMPVIAAVSYAAFRDVFLGREKMVPVTSLKLNLVPNARSTAQAIRYVPAATIYRCASSSPL